MCFVSSVCVLCVCVLCEWYYGPSVHPGILHVDSDGPCVVSDGPRGHVRPVVDCRIQGRCRAEPATVFDVECRATVGDEGRRASREVRREIPRRKKQGAAPGLHTQIPTRVDLKSIILKL